jgi:outer membrane protein assembly factor BamA
LKSPLDESYLLASYVNNTWYPTIAFSAYRIPGSARAYGNDLLVEALSGGDISILWPLDWADAPYVSQQVQARLRLVDIEPLSPTDFDASAGIRAPEAGQQADIRIAYFARKQRPYWNNLIHPLDGIGLKLQVTGAGRLLGADSEFIRGDVSAFGILPGLGFQRIYLYGRVQAQAGDAFAQDFVGLSEHDAVQLDLPIPLPITLGDTERVRGYRRYALGNRLLFGTLEYRVPLVNSLRTNLLGVISLGSVAGALFVDGGAVWTGANLDDAITRVGVGVELKNALRIGPLGVSHAIGFAQPAKEFATESYEMYYRIRTSVPF